MTFTVSPCAFLPLVVFVRLLPSLATTIRLEVSVCPFSLLVMSKDDRTD